MSDSLRGVLGPDNKNPFTISAVLEREPEDGAQFRAQFRVKKIEAESRTLKLVCELSSEAIGQVFFETIGRACNLTILAETLRIDKKRCKVVKIDIDLYASSVALYIEYL